MLGKSANAAFGTRGESDSEAPPVREEANPDDGIAYIQQQQSRGIQHSPSLPPTPAVPWPTSDLPEALHAEQDPTVPLSARAKQTNCSDTGDLGKSLPRLP